MMRTTPLFAFAMGLTAILAACDGKSVGDSASPPPPPVTVSQPLEKMITEWDEYTGRFTAVETVEIRARVSGFIESVHFKEGQIVKQGDLLFVIDPRPFRIAVDQAKADVERARAKLEIASHDVDRATPLARNATITDRELDTRKSVQRDAAGGVSSAEAALRQAELNLEWAAVRAPISGRISDRRVDAGNLIVGGSTGATLPRSHSIRVRRQRGRFHTLFATGGGRSSALIARRPKPRCRPVSRRERLHASGAHGFRR
jgi:multidrug efflux system membrane fusion protein